MERYKQLILDAEQHIYHHPETGFKEWETQKYLAEKMTELGYSLTYAGNVPGFWTDVDTGKEGPTVMLIAELDALIVESHPAADPVTHAAHACGHNGQCAIVLGVAAALKEPGATDGLCGKIRLMFLPAEELVELEWREEQRKKGILRYFSGKQEFIARGFFDDVDLSINFHSQCCPAGTMLFHKGNNGFVIKNAIFTGRSAHAAAAPSKGINALYAATNALAAINALRETFPAKDSIRVHPIITSGGGAVNAIPDRVFIENQVRAATVEAVQRESRRLNRAMAGSALALGANVTYNDRPGYMPLHNDELLNKTVQDAAAEILGADKLRITSIWSAGSTDMGDLSCIMPSVCAYVGGSKGGDHSATYHIADPEAQCVGGAKVMLHTARLLLENGAARAKEIMDAFVPVFENSAAYCQALDAMIRDDEAITYHEDGNITVNC